MSTANLPNVPGGGIPNLVYVGFNSRVIALDRHSGQKIWDWKSPQGTSSHVAVLVDEDRMFVSVQGYMYCLNPWDGSELWRNPLTGMGTGIPSLTTFGATTDSSAAAAAAAAAEEAAAAASSAAATTAFM